MHINYDGKTGEFSLVGIKKSVLKEIIKNLDASAGSDVYRSAMLDIRDDVEAMHIATLDADNEYVWTVDEEELPF